MNIYRDDFNKLKRFISAKSSGYIDESDINDEIRLKGLVLEIPIRMGSVIKYVSIEYSYGSWFLDRPTRYGNNSSTRISDIEIIKMLDRLHAKLEELREK